MKTKTLLLFFLTFAFKSLMAADVVLNNFETGSTTATANDGASFSIVVNPVSNGNATVNCLKVGRTGANWWESVSFTANFSVPANTIKYVHILANYSLTPELSISIDGGASHIMQYNTYSNFGKWQDIIFAIPGGTGGITVTSLRICDDRGVKLNNTTNFGYLDEIIINNNQALRSDMVLNDFEAGSPTVTAQYGASASIVANPVSNGKYSTENCLKIGRTTTQWWETVTFPVNFTVPANTTKYVHFLVNSSVKPALAVSLNGATAIAQFNSYNDIANWQDLVFAIPGGTGGLTVTSLSIQDDTGSKLNNTTTFEYIDEVILNDTQLPNYNYFTGNNLYDFETVTSGNSITGINTYSSTNDVITYPVANPFTTGINATANCGKRTANATPQWWSGFDFNFTKPIFVDANHKYLHIMLSTPASGQKVTIDVRQEGTAVISQTLKTITTLNVWQDVVIDVSTLAYVSGVRLDLGFNGATAAGSYYFDQFYIDGNSASRTTITTLTFATPTSVSKNYGDAAFTNAATSNSAGAKTYSSGNTLVATVNSSTGEVTIVGAGSAVIKASLAAIGSYTSSTSTYTLNVATIAPTLTFSTPSAVSKKESDAAFINDISSNSAGTITFSSDNNAVATVDASTGEVAIVAVGTAVITANQAGSGNYTSATAAYTLNVSTVTSILQQANEKCKVFVFNNSIFIENNSLEKNVGIYNVIGKQIYAKQISTNEIIKVNDTGLYFVKVGNQTIKVIVK
ncbi:MAG: T9SS type A sorting domain-containing protein [Paludibacter sp.]